MRDIIQKIIATESEARLVVESAKAEADRILSDAQKRGNDLVEQARAKALLESDEIIEAAAREAEKEKQLRLAETIAEIERQIRLEPTTMERTVEGVIRQPSADPQLTTVVLAIAVILLLTSLLGFCPLYVPFGWSTRKKSS